MHNRKNESYEEIHAKLAAAMQEACTRDEAGPYQNPTDDFNFIYENTTGKRTRQSKISRITKVAAIIIVVLLGMNLIMISTESNYSYSEKGLLHRIFEGTRGIFTDDEGTQFVKQDDVDQEFTITDFSQIDKAKRFWPDLHIPEYIPEGFVFDFLTITRDSENTHKDKYVFNNKDEKLTIIIYNHRGNMQKSNHSGNIIELSDRTINIYWDIKYNCYVADVYLEDVFVCMYGINNESEMIKISKSIN